MKRSDRPDVNLSPTRRATKTRCKKRRRQTIGLMACDYSVLWPAERGGNGGDAGPCDTLRRQLNVGAARCKCRGRRGCMSVSIGLRPGVTSADKQSRSDTHTRSAAAPPPPRARRSLPPGRESGTRCRKTASGRFWAARRGPRDTPRHPCTGNTPPAPAAASYLVSSWRYLSVCKQVALAGVAAKAGCRPATRGASDITARQSPAAAVSSFSDVTLTSRIVWRRAGGA